MLDSCTLSKTLSLMIRTIQIEDVKSLQRIYYEVTRDTVITGILKSKFDLSRRTNFIVSLFLSLIVLISIRVHLILQILLVQVITFLPVLCVLQRYVYYIIAYSLGHLLPTCSLLFDDDLRNIYNYYEPKNSHNASMYVAVSNNDIIGMIGVSDANIHKTGPYAGLRKSSDAELRRLNVLSRYRGQKVSLLLYQAVLDYALKKSVKRLILTTSSMQYVAFYFLYPSLGFKKIKEISIWNGLFYMAFFAKSLDT